MSPLSSRTIKMKNAAKLARKLYLRNERAVSAVAAVAAVAAAAAASTTTTSSTPSPSNQTTTTPSQIAASSATKRVVSSVPQRKTSNVKHLSRPVARFRTRSQTQMHFVTPHMDTGPIRDQKSPVNVNSRKSMRTKNIHRAPDGTFDSCTGV